MLGLQDEAREMKSDDNVTEEDFELYIQEATEKFEERGASSSAISRMKQRLNKIFDA